MLGDDDIEILIDQRVTAEDLFGEDESAEIPPLSPLNENNAGEDAAGDEAGAGGDDPAAAAAAKKEKRKVNRLPNLNEKWLTDPKREGIQQVNKYFDKMKFKTEKGHELLNLNKILKRYEYWAQQCYPKYCFNDVVKYVEFLSAKRPIKFALQAIRNKTETLNDDDMDAGNDVDDNAANQGNVENIFPNIQTPFDTPIDPIISSQPIISQPVASPSMTNELKEIIRRKREEAIAKRKKKLDESLNSSNISTTQSKGGNEDNISISQFSEDISDVIAGDIDDGITGDISDGITGETSSAVNVAHTSKVVNHAIEDDGDFDSDNDELKISEEPMIQRIGENIMTSLFEDEKSMETEDQKLSDEDDLPDFNGKVINSIIEKDTDAEIDNGHEKTDGFTIENLDVQMQNSVIEKEVKISDEDLDKNKFEASFITEIEDINENNEDKISDNLPSNQEEVVECDEQKISYQQEVVENTEDKISLIQDGVEEMDNFITEKEEIVESCEDKISNEDLIENSEEMNNSITESTEHEISNELPSKKEYIVACNEQKTSYEHSIENTVEEIKKVIIEKEKIVENSKRKSTEHEVSHEPPSKKEYIVECNEQKMSYEHSIENTVEEIEKVIIEKEKIVENSKRKISDEHLNQNTVEEVVNFVTEKESIMESNEDKISEIPSREE